MRVLRLILALPTESVRRASRMNPWQRAGDVDKVLHGNKRLECPSKPS
jgi:hypothetical protein